MAPDSPSRLSKAPLTGILLCPAVCVLWSGGIWLFFKNSLHVLPVLCWPMAPSTLVCMGLLVSAFLELGWTPRKAWGWRWARLVSCLVFILALLVVVDSWIGGIGHFLERLVVPEPSTLVDLIRQESKQMGRMSPITATLFLFLAPIPMLLQRHRQAAAALATVVLCGGLVMLLGFAMGTPLVHRATLNPTAFVSDLSFVSMGVAALYSSGFEVYPLSLFVLQGEEQGGCRHLRFTPGLIAAFMLAVLLVFGGSVAFLRAQRRSISQAAQVELATVADLKSQQISQWVLRLRRDVAVLASIPMLQATLGEGGKPNASLAWWLATVQAQRGYHSVSIFDAQGHLRFEVTPGSGGLSEAPRLAERLAGRQVLVEDFHWHEPSREIHMALWAPVLARGTDDRFLGAVRIEVDRSQSLAPMLMLWPAPRATAETLLGRREGQQVRILSVSHRRDDAWSGVRYGMEGPSDRPWVLAGLGHSGEVDGVDGRGVPVLAALRQIPGTSWFLIAKLDQSEVLASLRMWGWVTTILGFGVLGMTALGIGLQARRTELRDTERQLVLERSAKTMAERFHHLMREANDIVLLIDQGQRILEANLLAEERYGALPGGLAGLPFQDLVAPGSDGDFAEGMAALEATGAARFETMHKGAGGRAFPVALSLKQVEIDGTAYLLVLGRDITERKAHEGEIERLSCLYAALSRINQAIVRFGSREEVFAEVCRALVESGRFKTAWVGWLDEGRRELRPVAEFGDRGGGVRGLRILNEDVPGSRGPTGMAMRFAKVCVSNDLLADPSTRLWQDYLAAEGLSSLAALPILVKGEVQGTLSVYAQECGVFGAKEISLLEEASQDIAFAVEHLEAVASRARAEEEVLIQMDRLRLATASAHLGVWEMDFEKGLGYYDDRMGEICGVRGPRTFPLDGWQRLVHPEERERVQSVVQNAIQSGSGFSIPFRILRPDGQVRVLHGDALFVKNASGKVVRGIGLNRDMTDELRQEEERRALQIQLHQSQKLESLGILAGGVAHDMNNVLGAILTRATAERERMDPTSSIARAMDVIINACMRGRGVVKGLLCFARQDLEERCSVDLNALAREMVQLLAYTTLKRVAFSLELQEPLAAIQGDPGALSHALMNLCVNAVDAMPRGGTITMKTRALPDGRVQFCVHDSGSGMTPEVLEKATEPFFTTKPVGKGTGLGLSIVFGTMKAHGGTMEIESAPEKGTEVRLSFPAKPVEMAAQMEVPQPPDALHVATEKHLRILVVDDDDLIRESVGPMLELMGHQVTLASGGLEGLQVMREGGLDPDLVILDMNMPGINGAETLSRILAMRPDQAVLMSSGYSSEDISALLQGHGKVLSIQKPFTMKELEMKLAAVLGDSGTAT